MAQKAAMRTTKDRLRYTVSFELVLLSMLVPAGAMFFEKELSDIGILGLMLSGKAMLINMIYNWVFDYFDARAGRVSSDRSTLGRILHAVGFEGTLMLTTLPIYIWWLDLSLWQALATDLTVSSFILVFTYIFTLAYDRIYPVPQPMKGAVS